MQDQDLVSILTPCYNVEKYIDKFIESVVQQDYRPIELILVNDGSEDNTGDIIESKKTELEATNVTLKYIKKENGGQASAIAEGLKHVTGKYLTWPDSDDFLLEKSISKRVQFLKSNPDCVIVRANGYQYLEGNYNKPFSEISPIKKDLNIGDFLRFRTSWTPGCYMVKMSAFDETNPDRYIYNSRCGQNIQMLLPIICKYNCIYLDEYVYGYLIRDNSHSHSINTYQKSITHIDALYDCVLNTLKHVSMETKQFIKIHDTFIRAIRLENAWKYAQKQDVKLFYKEIINNNENSFEYWIMRFIPYNKVSGFIVKGIRHIRKS